MKTEPQLNAFHWRTGEASVLASDAPKPAQMYSQLAYYHRRKAGLTGSRQNPDRQWRKRQQEATQHG